MPCWHGTIGKLFSGVSSNLAAGAGCCLQFSPRLQEEKEQVLVCEKKRISVTYILPLLHVTRIMLIIRKGNVMSAQSPFCVFFYVQALPKIVKDGRRSRTLWITIGLACY